MIGARIVHHGRYVVFQLPEVAVPRVTLFFVMPGLVPGMTKDRKMSLDPT